jgi:hypothetical protein
MFILNKAKHTHKHIKISSHYYSERFDNSTFLGNDVMYTHKMLYNIDSDKFHVLYISRALSPELFFQINFFF